MGIERRTAMRIYRIAEWMSSPPIAEHADPSRKVVICQHCGTTLRARSFATIGHDYTCWHCHYHLHRCENCRYFDCIGCMLGRPERHTAIPGQQCPAFAYQSMRDVGTRRDEPALL
jgi:CBS domain-containing protein